MSEIKKRERLPNFSNTEKLKVIELIEKYKNIIENKKTDNINLKEKEKCWLNISKEYNSSNNSVYRDVASLKSCWDNLKKKTRKHYAEIRNEVFKTGGGKMNINDDPIAERIKSIIQPSIEGLTNNFDSDNITGIAETNTSQCNEESEGESCYQYEILEDSSNWTDWTPTKLCSEKSKELQVSDNLETEETEELIFEDVESVFDKEFSKENNPVTNKLPQSNLKYKKSKKTKAAAKKTNELDILVQSKVEPIEIMKEEIKKSQL
ncbi:myb/SANT-like DNA-binding domain-containing protein 3 isoform X1 [Monomorium pharaonis]|uniref:myb/SANT-like DNA-binding domain-containing protein 3 isoform X1 n=2 Tax=Monomorium pharaonis TaxID=307658 RepID=UPI001746354E|nr:myb/SANT-like DNA-binding domain-containing protein 3 isoform X1 [Monomorium pharaonis]